MDAAAVGRSSTNSFLTVYQNRVPTSSDVNYPIQQRWINISNPLASTEFILTSYSNNTGVLTANWNALGTASVVTATLTGNSGGAVGVDGSNTIFVVGDTTTINVVGNPGANTLTISTAGTVATTYNEDAGSAVPSAGVLRVIGGVGVNTSGAGNTITINSTAAVPLLFTENSGTATPAANNLNVLGGTGITTSGAGSTVTITTSAVVARQYDEDAGSAIPALGILKIVGGTGISTSGAGNTVTITNTSAASIQFNEDAGTATPAAGIINIRGGAGISTSGAGNTVTITATGGTAIRKVISQVFTANGTYTPSAGMVYCQIQCLGGGGAGGGSQAVGVGQYSIGSGGGAGEYAVGIFTAAAIGASKTVTIGAAGTGVLGAAGNNGGNTSVGALISSNGGIGGTTTAATSNSDNIAGGAGGTGGAGGDYRCKGNPGQGSVQAPNAFFVYPGNGANSQLGGGGIINQTPDTDGGNASLYGSGGASAHSQTPGAAHTGGNGSSGIVIITEYTT